MATIDWKSQQGRDWVEANTISTELKKLLYQVEKIRSLRVDHLKSLLTTAQKEVDAISVLIENPPKCECPCGPEAHGRNGCKTWYGDRNTGFGCDCDWKP